MRFTVEIEQEADGRWIAEITSIPGVMVYGETPELAVAKAKMEGIHANHFKKIHR